MDTEKMIADAIKNNKIVTIGNKEEAERTIFCEIATLSQQIAELQNDIAELKMNGGMSRQVLITDVIAAYPRYGSDGLININGTSLTSFHRIEMVVPVAGILYHNRYEIELKETQAVLPGSKERLLDAITKCYPGADTPYKPGFKTMVDTFMLKNNTLLICYNV